MLENGQFGGFCVCGVLDGVSKKVTRFVTRGHFVAIFRAGEKAEQLRFIDKLWIFPMVNFGFFLDGCALMMRSPVGNRRSTPLKVLKIRCFRAFVICSLSACSTSSCIIDFGKRTKKSEPLPVRDRRCIPAQAMLDWFSVLSYNGYSPGYASESSTAAAFQYHTLPVKHY